MNTTSIMANFLNIYGGWGLSTILMGVIAVLARHIRTIQLGKETREREVNEKLFVLMEQRIATDIKHEEAFKNLREVVSSLINKL